MGVCTEVVCDYTVDGCEALAYEQYREVFSFNFVHAAASDSSRRQSYTVVCPKNYTNMNFIPHMCTCHWSNSSRLPCRHASLLATVFKEYENGKGRFPLEFMFHQYWRKDNASWTTDEVIRARLGPLNH